MNETLRYLQSESAEAGIEIATLVKYILLDAVNARASDVHIEPWESTLAVRIRLNGVLTELVHLPLELMDKISGRFKVLGNLITYQTGLPQEGHAPADPELGGMEQRISIFPTTRGEKIVVRIFDPKMGSTHSLVRCHKCRLEQVPKNRTKLWVDPFPSDTAFWDGYGIAVPIRALSWEWSATAINRPDAGMWSIRTNGLNITPRPGQTDTDVDTMVYPEWKSTAVYNDWSDGQRH